MFQPKKGGRKAARLAAILTVAATASFVGAVTAQAEYPEKPIKIVVPFGPGGTTDLTARAFQKALTEDSLLSQPVSVVNVTGGAVGSVGSREVMTSDPDGYTFLIHHLGMMSAGAAGTHDFSYTDFDSVAGTTDFCHVLAVSVDSPHNSLGDLLAEAKANPDTIIYGANLGGNLHMAGLLLQGLEPGAEFRFVQIGGEADNVTALKGGIIEATTLSTGTYTRYKEEGLKALADFAPEREPTILDVPTAVEQGFDMSFCVQHWWWAPKGTPQEAIDTFAAALEKALQNEDLIEFFEGRSTLLTYESGDALKTKLDTTYEMIAPIAVRAKKK